MNGTLTDSVVIDQNLNSGGWVPIKRMNIGAQTLVKVEVSDPGGNQSSVLRADAVKIGMVDESLAADDNDTSPKEYQLSQNYPNPFNPLTVINYQVPKEGMVTIKIYNVLGKEIATLVNEYKKSGRYHTEFNGSGIASGVYIYRIQAGEYTASRKMVLLK